MTSPGRDELNRLICQIRSSQAGEIGVIGRLCGAKISAFTGLQELGKLDKHLRKKHKLHFEMNDLLDLRSNWEKPPIVGDADAQAERALRKRGP